MLDNTTREIQILLLPDHGNTVYHVLLSCSFDLLADWHVHEYKFIMTTLIKKGDDGRRFYTRSGLTSVRVMTS